MVRVSAVRLHRDAGKVLCHLPATGDAPMSPASYATARAPRRRKSRAKPPSPPAAANRPVPRFSWHPWEANLRAIWNCLGLGTFWEFDWRVLARHLGMTVPCACPG